MYKLIVKDLEDNVQRAYDYENFEDAIKTMDMLNTGFALIGAKYTAEVEEVEDEVIE